MRYAFVIALLLTPAFAQAQSQSSCTDSATSKHLAGAALNSFMTKCKMDTTSRCNQSASEKKLSGAARTSFTKKCIDDGIGATS